MDQCQDTDGKNDVPPERKPTAEIVANTRETKQQLVMARMDAIQKGDSVAVEWYDTHIENLRTLIERCVELEEREATRVAFNNEQLDRQLAEGGRP